jgi:hypothetical protein
LLILDDWGLATLTQEQGRDILEIVEDRHNRGSTIVTSQLPVDHWHEAITNPTIADAILDRLVHNAHRLTLKGEGLRKTAARRAVRRRGAGRERCEIGFRDREEGAAKWQVQEGQRDRSGCDDGDERPE